jgi:two-component system, NtrC family, sensor kinase
MPSLQPLTDVLGAITRAVRCARAGNFLAAQDELRGIAPRDDDAASLRVLGDEFASFLGVLRESIEEKELVVGELQLSQAGLEATNERLQEEVRRRTEAEAELQLAQRLESVGHLASGIAHEINTPVQFVTDNVRFLSDNLSDVMTIVMMVKEQLDAEPASRETGEREIRRLFTQLDIRFLQEEIPEALAHSLEGLQRVAAIVRAMKEFARPGGGEMAEVNLNQAIETTIAVTRHEWNDVADLQTDFDPALPLVRCLPQAMNQVLLALIVNAAEALAEQRGPRPAEKGAIRIGTRVDGEWVEIHVEDDGPGIPAANVRRIFDPFFTTKEVGKGTGQGLAIARSVVVDKHRGTLTCLSDPPRGTRFVIRVPVRAPSHATELWAE